MRLVRSALLLLVCSAAPIVAAAQPAAEPPPRWERKGELSLVATGGNTDTQTLGLGGTIVWRPGIWTTEARLAFVRSETADVLTAKSLVAELRESRALTPRADLFGRFGYLSNEFAGIDRRASLDGGVGYKALPGPVHTVRLEAGLGYAHESRTIGDDLSVPLATFGAGYKWQLSKTADVTNAALLTAALDDGSDWRFGNALAVTSALTSLLSLKLSHELKFVNAPVVGFEKTDTLLSVALVAAF